MTASPWDRLKHHGTDGYVWRHQRSAFRSAKFDEAILADSDFALSLGEELKHRRMFWRQQRQLLADTPPNRMQVAILGLFAAWAILTLMLAIAFRPSIAMLLTTPLIGVMIVLQIRTGGRPTSRLLRALDVAVCPACEYDLTGLDHWPSHHMLEEHCGPQLCPECGTSWPLVPPPCPR